MDINHYQGDLADIVRASGSTAMTTTATKTTTSIDGQIPKWRFGSSNNNNNLEYHQLKNDVYSLIPTPDTLLRDMDTSSNTFLNDFGIDHSSKGGGGGGVRARLPITINNKCFCNIFSSNMVQISEDSNTSNKANSGSNNNHDVKRPILPAAEAASPKNVKAAAGFGFISNQMMSNSSKGAFVDGETAIGGVQLQIPSPRNQGIKRRKIQAKKVVCIPAPAAANSRQTGEVVPSDLWAWRKYGQKPIKGSPYPRGYYRCSSSKGCSARKQVERSRTDPNMLVITYTSEHNHPWPTQRNALAGSTRSSQPASKTSSKASQPSQKPSNNNFHNVLIKEENQSVSTTTTTLPIVKEEEIRLNDDRLDSNKVDEIIESYRPLIFPEPKINEHDQQPDQDFFADLVEFETDDPLELFTTQRCKGFDSFSGLFDWATNNTTTNEEENENDRATESSHQQKFKR